ncbi:MAG: carbohydrate ABC transporter permease [Clostridiaceae bacterium]
MKVKYLLVAILSIFALISVFPILWMFIIALKPGTSVISTPPDLSLYNITLINFINLFKNSGIIRWIFNSLFVSITVMLLNVLFSSMAGYSFSKKDYPGKKILFTITIGMMMVSTQVIMVPLFIQVKNLGLYNTYMGLILPVMSSPLYVFLSCQYMRSISNELLSAARIDGCSELSTFTKIVLPMSVPVLGIICIFCFITQWNDLLWPLVITGSKEMRTLTVGLATTQLQTIDYGFLMAGSVVATIPILIIFFSFQKFFVTGLTVGSVKE